MSPNDDSWNLEAQAMFPLAEPSTQRKQFARYIAARTFLARRILAKLQPLADTCVLQKGDSNGING